MSSASSRPLLGLRNFRLFLAGRVLSSGAVQIQAVAVAWQIYDITQDPLSLGLVGLAQFLPMAGLILVAGDLADRFDRRLIMATSYLVQMLCAILFLALTAGAIDRTWAYYGVLALFGAARAFAAPASQSLLPLLVPQALFPSAIAWGASAHQAATIAGPALGGLLYVLGPMSVYATCALLFLAIVVTVAAMNIAANPSPRSDPAALRRVFAGIAYIRKKQLLLGAISLDLFAVLLGGVTALLPVYARDILFVGPEGLGLMRSAPAIGAASVAFGLGFRPLRRHAGRALFAAVALFGIATVVFGVSENFALSMAALVVLGAADMVSVYVRQTLVQLATPDPMRGRVSAVNMLFIGASNELGEFESGLTAAWFGTVEAVIVGGVGTLVIVGLWAWRFPDLRRVDRLAEVTPS